MNATPPGQAERPDPGPIERYILHERDGVVVINKPAPLPTSGRHLHDDWCAQSLLIRHFGAMTWAVHQLDTPTTGLNVFVRRRELVPIWQQRLRYPVARKEYLAICHGELPEGSTRVDAPLGRLPDGGHGVTPDGKEAVTIVHRLASAGGFSVARCVLRTGRTHQIRLHLASLGHPLVGEARYRGEPCTLLPRHALHAWRLRMATVDEPRLLVAPVPADLIALCARLGLPDPRDVLGPEAPTA